MAYKRRSHQFYTVKYFCTLMTTKIDSITSDVQTTFSSVPSVQTMVSSDNSTKLASIGYVANQGMNATTYLDKTTNQTITGTYSITNQPTISTIDRSTAGDINCGLGTNTLLTINYITLTIKTYLQNLSNYWMVGNLNVTSTTPTIVNCKKVQTGQVSIAASSSVPVVFSPAFSAKPVVLISVQSTSSSNFGPTVEWASSITTNGFTANYRNIGAGLVLNWMAIGT